MRDEPNIKTSSTHIEVEDSAKTTTKKKTGAYLSSKRNIKVI